MFMVTSEVRAASGLLSEHAYLSTRIKEAGIAICHLQGYMSTLQCPEIDVRGWTSGTTGKISLEGDTVPQGGSHCFLSHGVRLSLQICLN